MPLVLILDKRERVSLSRTMSQKLAPMGARMEFSFWYEKPTKRRRAYPSVNANILYRYIPR